ncbi:uncharacterized protein LOC130717501 [Lotus japonicus]|uniref:uncharacterized protein LOC130717501 n=1 Tax=Lotus japonicus TaxID=34305 RepID=UPI002584666B|nr:uncharacterized protein LOC130717501 [Lotus japonicus]
MCSLNNWKSATSRSIAHGTAFLAEIKALELGMLHTLQLGYRTIICYSDCAGLVSVLNSGQDISSFWDRDILRRVLDLMASFDNCTVAHVAREKNNTADTLAREAAKSGSASQVWNVPPSFVSTSLFLDAS